MSGRAAERPAEVEALRTVTVRNSPLPALSPRRAAATASPFASEAPSVASAKSAAVANARVNSVANIVPNLRLRLGPQNRCEASGKYLYRTGVPGLFRVIRICS